MTDENDRTAGAGERGPYCGRVVSNCVEMILSRDHLKAIRQEQRDNLAVTRAIGPEAMRENDAWFGHGSLHWWEGGLTSAHRLLGPWKRDKDFVSSAYALKV